mmetsp:Transcript_39510/g.66226  ORF Transcript_39510/g.66226 Transcript_39510/m.66226 type:complete len:114 (+) Transcript_39510:705-1046(+)
MLARTPQDFPSVQRASSSSCHKLAVSLLHPPTLDPTQRRCFRGLHLYTVESIPLICAKNLHEMFSFFKIGGSIPKQILRHIFTKHQLFLCFLGKPKSPDINVVTLMFEDEFYV